MRLTSGYAILVGALSLAAGTTLAGAPALADTTLGSPAVTVAVQGTLLVVPSETVDGHPSYAVALPGGDLVPVRGRLEDARPLSHFAGTLALPPSVTTVLAARGATLRGGSFPRGDVHHRPRGPAPGRPAVAHPARLRYAGPHRPRRVDAVDDRAPRVRRWSRRPRPRSPASTSSPVATSWSCSCPRRVRAAPSWGRAPSDHLRQWRRRPGEGRHRDRGLQPDHRAQHAVPRLPGDHAGRGDPGRAPR